MGHKSVCLQCRKTFNRVFDNRGYPCPHCKQPMVLLPHRFRPPGKNDDQKWETVKFLIENGFYYQHIWEKIEFNGKIIGEKGYVAYPENLRDAKAFVEKYKSQALKKSNG